MYRTSPLNAHLQHPLNKNETHAESDVGLDCANVVWNRSVSLIVPELEAVHVGWGSNHID
jgi:hypothetical protein